MTITDEMRVAALMALVKAAIEIDTQELLIYGNLSRCIPPRALDALISAVAPLIAAQERKECERKVEAAIRQHERENGPSGGAWNISMMLERTINAIRARKP